MEHIQWIIFIHVENARLATLKEHKNPTQVYTLALTRTRLLTDIMQEHLKTNQTASVWNKPCSLLRSKGNGKPELFKHHGEIFPKIENISCSEFSYHWVKFS